MAAGCMSERLRNLFLDLSRRSRIAALMERVRGVAGVSKNNNRLLRRANNFFLPDKTGFLRPAFASANLAVIELINGGLRNRSCLLDLLSKDGVTVVQASCL